MVTLPVPPNQPFVFTSSICAPIAAVPPKDWWPDYLENPAIRQQYFTPGSEEFLDPNKKHDAMSSIPFVDRFVDLVIG